MGYIYILNYIIFFQSFHILDHLKILKMFDQCWCFGLFWHFCRFELLKFFTALVVFFNRIDIFPCFDIFYSFNILMCTTYLLFEKITYQKCLYIFILFDHFNLFDDWDFFLLHSWFFLTWSTEQDLEINSMARGQHTQFVPFSG